MSTNRWRVGRSLGRTIYLDDSCVGIVDTTELARTLVDAANGEPDVKIIRTPSETTGTCGHCRGAVLAEELGEKMHAEPAPGARKSGRATLERVDPRDPVPPVETGALGAELAARGAERPKVPADVAGLVKGLRHTLAVITEHGRVSACVFAEELVSYADALEALARENAAQGARAARLEVCVSKVDAIRNDIIGRQRVSWSDHIYPLVAALGEAGREGVGYDKSREGALSTDARLVALETENAALRAALVDVRAELVTGYREWDSDQDHRVGKRLANACDTIEKALAGLTCDPRPTKKQAESGE